MFRLKKKRKNEGHSAYPRRPAAKKPPHARWGSSRTRPWPRADHIQKRLPLRRKGVSEHGANSSRRTLYLSSPLHVTFACVHFLQAAVCPCRCPVFFALCVSRGRIPRWGRSLALSRWSPGVPPLQTLPQSAHAGSLCTLRPFLLCPIAVSPFSSGSAWHRTPHDHRHTRTHVFLFLPR